MNNEFEFNWYLVIDSALAMYENNDYTFYKKGIRLYPINKKIPLIHKKFGCNGFVKVKSIKIFEYETEIEFQILELIEEDSEIAKHYFNMYREMKKQLNK